MVKEFVNRGKLAKSEFKIWRYMDLSKLISILDKKALYFPRADNLGDPFEGSFPKINIQKRQHAFSTHDGPGLITLSDYYKKFIKCTVINCWHINDDESDAMWKIYIKGGEGIAIQSTVGRLKASLLSYPEHSSISVGMVAYVNYEEDRIPDNTLAPYFHKRKSFKHEQEYRAIIQRIKHKQNSDIDFKKSTLQDGVYIPVDIDKLVENVHLSPTCPLWQKEVAQSILKKYKLNRNIRQSKLSEEPQY
jgi:hypothetical protein